MSAIYLERKDEEPIRLTGYGNCKLFHLTSLYGAEIELEEIVLCEDSMQGVEKCHAADAVKLADAIERALPDIPNEDCRAMTIARAVGIDAVLPSQEHCNVLEFWSGRREFLQQIADFCRRGEFEIFSDY